jgi:hypothetical protein
MVEPVADQNIAAQERDLVGLDHHQAGGKTGQSAIPCGRPVEAPREQPQREGEEGQALDLGDVLNAPCRGRAEGKSDRRDNACAGMPPFVPAESLDGDAAEAEQDQDKRIELPETRDFLEIGKQDGGRKQQGLRIGYLWDADERAGIPVGRLARMERIGQELELGLK